MFKRLALSLVLMGLAAFSLGAGAVAWFSDSGQAAVEINAGTADLQFSVDVDCNGIDIANSEAGPGDLTFNTWTDIAPGDATEDCITVHNVGDTDLDLYVRHAGGNLNDPLGGALQWSYDVDNDGSAECGPVPPRNALYEDPVGCFLGNVAAGGDLLFAVNVSFPDSGDQNDLQGDSLAFDVFVTGYTEGFTP